MTYIVNLSSLHTLNPISTGFTAFADLCDDYSDSCCTSYCPGFFSSPTNKAWVMFQYHVNFKQIIHDYKIGKINTDEFLNKLSKIFYFLPENQAHRLLAQAWNSIIDFLQNDKVKFQKILDISKQEPVYLVSNTNELNVSQILSLLKDNFPEVAWGKNINLSVEANNQPIEIAPNIYLCLSYKYGLFKTDGLIKKVIENQSHGQLSNINVVSQFAPDLEQARKMDIPEHNLCSSDTFYQISNNSYKMR